MKLRIIPLNRIKLVCRRSSPLVKCVVLATIVLCTATLLLLGTFQWKAQQNADALREQAAQLEQENARLEDSIEDLGSVESIKQIAGEELDLVDPNTVIYLPNQK